MRSLLILTMLASFGHAQTPGDELGEALVELRRQVTPLDRTAHGRLIHVGGVLIPVALAMALSTVPLPARTVGGIVLHRRLRVAAAAAGGLGALALGYGMSLKQERVPLGSVVDRDADYRTVQGLREFMALSHQDQEAYAHQHPDFAGFLVELARSYRMAKAYRLRDCRKCVNNSGWRFSRRRH